MSHRDGESSALVFPVDVAVTWAAKATGTNATNAKANTRKTILENLECMRLSSAIKLNDQMENAVSEHKFRLVLTRLRTMNTEASLRHFQTYHRMIPQDHNFFCKLPS
jgi:hypothetical protein